MQQIRCRAPRHLHAVLILHELLLLEVPGHRHARHDRELLGALRREVRALLAELARA